MTLSPELIAARRFGYGPAATPPQDAAVLLAGLAGPDAMRAAHPAPDLRAVLDAEARFRAAEKARKAASGGRERGPEEGALLRAVGAMVPAILIAGLARIAASPTPFRERLAWFWADHFTVAPRGTLGRPLPGPFMDEAVRPHLAGRFGDMLKAAATHPAMVLYLDQYASVGPGSKAGKGGRRGLNENLAREVLELHTLGAGSGYTQTDVREFAELLTGLTFDRGDGTVYRPNFAEPGAETVLGARYDGTGIEVIHRALDDLAVRPETARHLARKLAVHFVSDDPPADLVAAMAAAWSGSGGDLMEVYRAMLAHPAAWSPHFAKVRQPLDYIGAGLRALGVVPERSGALDGEGRLPGPERQFVNRTGRALTRMGQPFLRPIGPDGWPEETAAWLSPQGLAARIGWAMRMPAKLLKDLPDPRGFAARAVGEEETEVIRAASRAETPRQAIGLVLASPAFMRR